MTVSLNTLRNALRAGLIEKIFQVLPAAAIVVLAASTTTACQINETAIVPNVVGQPLDVAETLLQEAGFDHVYAENVVGTVFVVNWENWAVTEQTQPGGSSVRIDEEIRLGAGPLDDRRTFLALPVDSPARRSMALQFSTQDPEEPSSPNETSTIPSTPPSARGTEAPTVSPEPPAEVLDCDAPGVELISVDWRRPTAGETFGDATNTWVLKEISIRTNNNTPHKITTFGVIAAVAYTNSQGIPNTPGTKYEAIQVPTNPGSFPTETIGGDDSLVQTENISLQWSTDGPPPRIVASSQPWTPWSWEFENPDLETQCKSRGLK